MVGLVLYISSINDEMLNRTKDSESFFNYKYGWSFAFSAISFLLTEVPMPCNKCIPFPGLGRLRLLAKRGLRQGLREGYEGRGVMYNVKGTCEGDNPNLER